MTEYGIELWIFCFIGLYMANETISVYQYWLTFPQLFCYQALLIDDTREANLSILDFIVSSDRHFIKWPLKDISSMNCFVWSSFIYIIVLMFLGRIISPRLGMNLCFAICRPPYTLFCFSFINLKKKTVKIVYIWEASHCDNLCKISSRFRDSSDNTYWYVSFKFFFALRCEKILRIIFF